MSWDRAKRLKRWNNCETACWRREFLQEYQNLSSLMVRKAAMTTARLPATAYVITHVDDVGNASPNSQVQYVRSLAIASMAPRRESRALPCSQTAPSSMAMCTRAGRGDFLGGCKSARSTYGARPPYVRRPSFASPKNQEVDLRRLPKRGASRGGEEPGERRASLTRPNGIPYVTLLNHDTCKYTWPYITAQFTRASDFNGEANPCV